VRVSLGWLLDQGQPAIREVPQMVISQQLRKGNVQMHW